MDQHKLNKFAMQAGGIWRGGHVEQPNGDSVWTEQKWVDPCDMDLNKFAELIVRECISVMDATDKEARENFTYMDNDVPTTAHQFEIRKHFGVEK